MSLTYGLTNPAAMMGSEAEVTPDLFKFYTSMPTRSTESTAANKRRPVLYGSFNGIRWKYESKTGGFYNANYCGNFLFRGNDSTLTGFAHKSASSSYGAYKARAGLDDAHKIRLGTQGWETSSVVAYSTTNQPDRQLCRNLSSSRFFCIRNGGGLVYNNTAWGTADWTSLSGPSGTTFSDDGGFRHICINTEREHEALVYLVTNDTNKYMRFYLFDTSTNTFGTDYTTTIWGNTTHKQTNYKYSSIGYLPGIGYLIFYCYGSDNNWCVKRLLTHDLTTGELLPFDQYVLAESIVRVGTFPITQYGSHGWYCPWTKEYYFVPSARQVFWTKDGLNWNSSTVTSASTSTACVKFMTDGQTMVVATSGSAYYYSRDKGQTWWNDVTLSPDGFNTSRSNDCIVLPFKCINNIGINTNDLVLGKSIDRSDGSIVDSSSNFYLDSFIPVDPDTSYVFYGSCNTVHNSNPLKQKTFFNRILYYDSNYNYISGKEGADFDIPSTSQKEVPCIYTSPSNAAYARVTCNMENVTATQQIVDYYDWYFAKEDDFKVMNNYGDIIVD